MIGLGLLQLAFRACAKFLTKHELIFILLCYIAVISAIYTPVVFLGKSTIATSYHSEGLPEVTQLADAGRKSLNSFSVDLATPAYQETTTNRLVGDMYRSGHIPLWDPYDASGIPLAAQYSTRAFFPYQILEDVSPYWMWDYFQLGRLVIAAFFTFLFLTALGLSKRASFLGGLFYGCYGAMIWFINLEEMANVAMSLPILLFSLEKMISTRRPVWVAGCAVSFALVLAAGQPETALFGLLLAGLYALYRIMSITQLWSQRLEDVVRVMVAFGLGLGLSAPLFIPFWELVQNGYSGHLPGMEIGTIFPVPNLAWLLGIFLPTSSTIPGSEITMPLNRNWDYLGGYVGMLPVFLAVAGLIKGRGHKGLLLFFSAVGLVIVLKNFGVVPFHWLGHLPLLDLIWSPRWSGPVWNICFAIAGALGFQALIAKSAQPVSSAGMLRGQSLWRSWQRRWQVWRTRWLAGPPLGGYEVWSFMMLGLGAGLIVGGLVLNRVVLEQWLHIDWDTSWLSLRLLSIFQIAGVAMGGVLVFNVRGALERDTKGLGGYWSLRWIPFWALFSIGVAMTNYPDFFSADMYVRIPVYASHPTAFQPPWPERWPYVVSSVWGGVAVAGLVLGIAFWLGRKGYSRPAILNAFVGLAIVEAWFLIPRGYDIPFPALSLIPVLLGLAAVILLVSGSKIFAQRRHVWVWGLVGLALVSSFAIDLSSPKGLPSRQDPFQIPPYLAQVKEQAGWQRIMATEGVLMPNFGGGLGLFDVRSLPGLPTDLYWKYSGKLMGAELTTYPTAHLWFDGQSYRQIDTPIPELQSVLGYIPASEAFVRQLPYYSLLGVKYVITPRTNEFIYTDGFGDWTTIDLPDWPTGARFLDLDAYKADSQEKGTWRREDDHLAVYSTTPQSLIYRFEFDQPIKSGRLHVWAKLKGGAGSLSVFLSSDGSNWGGPVMVAAGREGNHYLRGFTFPDSLTGKSSLYVKFVGQAASEYDSTDLEQWGVWVELEYGGTSDRVVIEGEERREVECSLPLPLVYEGEVLVYENPEALPRTWVAHEIEYVMSPEEAWEDMLRPDIDLRNTALVEEYVPGLDGDSTTLATTTDSASIITYEPNKVVIGATTNSPGMLVLSDVFYPGWEASVDGEPAYIYRVDGIIRGVFLSPGEHTVSFQYRPKSFFLGLLVAFVSLVVILVWVMSKPLRRWMSRTTGSVKPHT